MVCMAVEVIGADNRDASLVTFVASTRELEDALDQYAEWRLRFEHRRNAVCSIRVA
jgi:hypothetical protein